LKQFEKVDKANYLAKSHPKNFNQSALNKELQKVMDQKTNFIKNFQKEIALFCSEHKNVLNNVIEGFKNLLNFVNTNVKFSLNSRKKTK
jgi:hypothetical protein